MLGKRLAVLTISVLVLGGAASAVPLLTSGGVAAAKGASSHKLTLRGNTSGAVVEGKLKGKFTCAGPNATLKISGINVVDSTGNAFTQGVGSSAIGMRAGGEFFPTDYTLPTPMTQDTDGLWRVNTVFTIDPSLCVTGEQWTFVDQAFPEDLNTGGTLP